MVIASGFGYTAPNAVGALLAGSALILAFWSTALERLPHDTNTLQRSSAA
jgi:DHA1 family inner membrane transport protein